MTERTGEARAPLSAHPVVTPSTPSANTSHEALQQQDWSPVVERDNGPLPRATEDGDDERLGSTVDSIGVFFKADDESPMAFVRVSSNTMDAVAVSHDEGTQMFGLESRQQQLGCVIEQDAFYLEQPRAGGVRTPAAGSGLQSGTPETPRSRRHSGMESSQLHRQSNVRMWNRSKDNPAGVDHSTQTAESYLQSRVNPYMVAHHRPSSSVGGRSCGSRSPQMWRGETIEESLTPYRSPSQTPGLGNLWRTSCDSGVVGHSNLSSRCSSALPMVSRRVSGAVGSSKLADAAVASSGEGHPSPAAAVAATQSLVGDSHPVSIGTRPYGEHGVTKKSLLDKMEGLERRMQVTEKRLVQVVEKFETCFAQLESCVGDLQRQMTHMMARIEPSLPQSDSRAETREPSRAMDL
ncbi:hypothetical protein DQ04_00121010 [Trypanosoma grayi]|uniref:hypothetical protein n=1 Tax=Trypanosoma grayi TaxID=71804 RepID=UPI0004F3FBA3|nr:hypothetical protein DQ04_00121010 [Trypanosoma grayi]KEG15269.1 hypothetical protein DQ04_00121010 [Trypanosoma grayi]